VIKHNNFGYLMQLSISSAIFYKNPLNKGFL
jgi:hypothetical protein